MCRGFTPPSPSLPSSSSEAPPSSGLVGHGEKRKPRGLLSVGDLSQNDEMPKMPNLAELYYPWSRWAQIISPLPREEGAAFGNVTTGSEGPVGFHPIDLFGGRECGRILTGSYAMSP